MSKSPSYSVCFAIFKNSVINLFISTRHKAFIFYRYTVCVAGNCLVKFALITDSHLLDIGSQSLHYLKGEGKRKNIFPKRPMKILLLLHFLIVNISTEKCSKNL